MHHSLGAQSVSVVATASVCTATGHLQGCREGMTGPVVPLKVESQRAGHTAPHKPFLPQGPHKEGQAVLHRGLM